MSEATQRPVALPVAPDRIPGELKAIPNWVGWRYEWRVDKRGEGKWTKPPHHVDGGLASSTDPATWTRFEEALAAYERGGFDGVGLVVAKNLGIVGADFDHCRDPETGVIDQEVLQAVERLQSYTEVSPSAAGLRVFAYATLPLTGRKRGQVEIYDSGRFLTVTGHHLLGTPRVIMESQAEVEALHTKVFGKSKKARSDGGAVSEDEIIDRAMGARNGNKFSRLWNGDISGYPSASEADLALCAHLAFWTDRDPLVMDRLFRQSGLMRPKWNERHASDERSYGQMTVGKALEASTAHYEPGGVGPNGRTPVDETVGPSRAFPHTDLGNAERLVQLQGHDLRYCHPWWKWLVWDRKRWKIDDTGEVYRRASDTVRTMYAEASRLEAEASQLGDDATEERRKRLAEVAEALSEWARKSESRSRIEAMVRLAQSRPGIPVLRHELDSDNWVLNCENGTLDLRTGRLKEHRREDFITNLDSFVKTPRQAGARQG